jgi:hypothetical protein
VRLTTGIGGVDITEPDPDQVAQVMGSLPGGADSFAILAQDDQHYIQAMGSREEGFLIEYRNGSDREHYRAVDPSVDTDMCANYDSTLLAFQQYAARDMAFRSHHRWESAFGPRTGARADGPPSPEDIPFDENPAWSEPEVSPLEGGAATAPRPGDVVRPTAGCLGMLTLLVAVTMLLAAGLH